MIISPELLKGKTIQLETLNINHFEGLRRVADDERIWEFMPQKANGVFFENWFKDCLLKQTNKTQLSYVVRRLSDSALLGCRAYYDIDVTHKRLEVGHGWFSPLVWGMHFNFETFFLLFQNVFEHLKFNRLQMGTDPRNIRSYKGLKKLGATQEGILREHMVHHTGLVTDTVMFSILRSDWPNIKNNLASKLNF